MRIELSANSRHRNHAAGRRQAPPRHVLEQILAWRLTRRALGAMTRLDSTGTCFFERACEHYNNSGLSGRERLKWRLLDVVIDYTLKHARLDRDFMTEKLFHHQPTVRALALAGRRIARYGLAAPQRFAAPLMVVWNFNRRDHCATRQDRSYCGGCRARAFAYLDDIRAGDPGCERNEELWDELAAPTESLIAIAEEPRPNSTDNVTA